MYTIKDFNERMDDMDYASDVCSTYSLQCIYNRTDEFKYMFDIDMNEVNKMALETKKPEIKQKSDLDEEELQILTDIVNNKYSVGAFTGMIFNASISNPDECPIKLVEKAVKTRKLIRDMSYQL